MTEYRRGFRPEAEQLAAALRDELGIGLYRRLDAHALAARLDVPVMSLGQLPELGEALTVLHGPEIAAFSAMTVFDGTRRMIVHNDAHNLARQASNLCHELAHGVLLHPAKAALDSLGCRDWDGAIEREATFLGGALLIPGKAIWWAAKKGDTRAAIADEYGCSLEMVQMRLNLTGAGRRFPPPA